MENPLKLCISCSWQKFAVLHVSPSARRRRSTLHRQKYFEIINLSDQKRRDENEKIAKIYGGS